MSEIIQSPFKKQSCTDMHQLGNITLLKDSIGGIIDLQIVGTDPEIDPALVDESNPGVIVGTNIIVNYAPAVGNKNVDTTFFICIEAEGIFFVNLADGTDFIITAVQSAAYLGQWVPMRILSVNVGTTGSFSVGY